MPFHSDINGHVMMVSPMKGRAVIDINATGDKHHVVMNNLLAAHGITGCDTVTPYFGIGKNVALKTLKSNMHTLDKVGDMNSSLPDAIQEAMKFMLSCYGHPECESLTAARQKIRSAKVYPSLGAAPKLESLPSTNEAFNEIVACAHL